MHFGTAMSLVLEGKKVRRADWNRPSHIERIYYVRKMTNPIIAMVMRDVVVGPYTPSGCDMVATDWHECI